MICNEILQKERYGNYDELRLSLSHSLSLLANSLSLCSRFTHFYSSQINHLDTFQVGSIEI